MNWKIPALAVTLFVLLILALQATGVVPSEALASIIKGSLGSPTAISRTLKETMPLLLAGIAVFVALKAGLFNIGVEGQLLVGACAAAAVAIQIPTVFGMILAILASMVCGAIWALPAALIKVYRGGHEVISTIMLNNIALFLTQWVVTGPLQSKASESQTTDDIAQAARLPNILTEPYVVNVSLAAAVALVPVLAWWMKKTIGGFELRATGAGNKAALFAGVKTAQVQIRAMVVSGAVAGLAGSCVVLASEGRFYPNFSPGYGFDGLGVALLAGSSPIGLLPAAFGFGMLASGSSALSLMGIPRGVSSLLLGILIIIFAAFRYREVRNRG